MSGDDRQRHSEFRDDVRRFADDIRAYSLRYKDFRGRPPRPLRQPRITLSQHSPLSGAIVGALIIAVGVIMLLDTLGIVRARDFWDYAPLGLTALGLVKLLDSYGRPSALAVGAILSAVGIFWFLNNIGMVLFNPNLIWPLLIIFWGAMLLLKTLENRGFVPPSSAPPDAAGGSAPNIPPNIPPNQTFRFCSSTGTTAAGFTNYFAFFGGGRRVVDSKDFRGADLFAMFGGGDIDLRRAEISSVNSPPPPGTPPSLAAQMRPGQAVIQASALYGGFTIKVPTTWWVEVQGMGIFGGYVDKTIHPPSDMLAAAPRLIVHGFAIFGGITVTN